MTKSVFSEEWLSSFSHSLEKKPAVSQLKFGDGYEQRTAKGINTAPETWSLKFTYDYARAGQIMSFLEEQGGLKSFIWKTPLSRLITVVCREWTVSTEPGLRTISAKFEQVFEV